MCACRVSVVVGMSESGAKVFGEDVSHYMDRWIGCIAVVTGVSAGIGAAVCERLVRLGLTVVGMARRVETMDALATKLAEEKGKFHPMFCDLTNETNIQEVFAWIDENLGGVAIMINNAGVMFPTTLADGNISEWRATLDVNVMALCICTKLAIASMRKYGIDGHVVHISSIYGHYLPDIFGFNMNMYPPSKQAVTALTELLRRELRTQENPKIKISSVSPGLVSTEFIDHFPTEGGLRDAIRQAPSITPDDVTDSIIFVLSTPPHVQIHDVVVRVTGEGF